VLVADFWANFFLLLIFLPLAMLWAFALVDIFRRDDIGGFSKALWIVCIILIPFFGTLIYMVFRPAAATREERADFDRASREFAQPHSPDDSTSRLKVLSDLHERGKLTDDEFAAEKARILGAAGGSTAPATT
jgi:hypothetical protein